MAVLAVLQTNALVIRLLIVLTTVSALMLDSRTLLVIGLVVGGFLVLRKLKSGAEQAAAAQQAAIKKIEP